MHSKLPLALSGGALPIRRTNDLLVALSGGALPIRRTNDLLVWLTEAPTE
jgi:hypothetical protein